MRHHRSRAADRRPSRNRLHRPDVLSLCFGVAFAIVGASALAGDQGTPTIGLDLLLAIVAVAAGLGVLASLIPTRTSPIAEPLPPPPVAIPTPEALREEDREWFGAASDLTQVEREVLEAVRAAEADGAGSTSSSSQGDQGDRG